MLRLSLIVLPAWFAAGLLLSQATATPPLPAWQDNASVYLKTDRLAAARTAEYTADHSPESSALLDAAVAAAHHDEPAASDAATGAPTAEPAPVPPDTRPDHRRLAPPTSSALAPGRGLFDKRSHVLPGLGLPADSLYTTLTALAMVIGLFLLCAWALRRGARSPSVLLPGEVVSVLGRVPLAARQFAQLLRVGNKLVLVSVTTAGAETLAEVTDPAEVDRLLGICQQHDPKSTTREFEEVFRQLARQPAPDAFIDRDAPVTRDVYPAYRGGTARG